MKTFLIEVHISLKTFKLEVFLLSLEGYLCAFHCDGLGRRRGGQKGRRVWRRREATVSTTKSAVCALKIHRFPTELAVKLFDSVALQVSAPKCSLFTSSLVQS